MKFLIQRGDLISKVFTFVLISVLVIFSSCSTKLTREDKIDTKRKKALSEKDSISEFWTNYSTIMSFKWLADFLNDADNYKKLKSIIGDSCSENIKFTQVVCEKIEQKPKKAITLLFSKDNSGAYYFQKIPLELIGHFFYLLQQQYPLDFKKGMDTMAMEANKILE